MKKQLYITALLLIFSLSITFGQSKEAPCDCPETQYAGTKADTTFHLSNGKSIVLCGYKDTDLIPTAFSEFVLSVCGQDSIIGFWGAVLTCHFKVNKDTLVVEEIQNFPTGKNFKYQEVVWTREKLYFDNQLVHRKLVVNRQIRKYTPSEIQAVLKEYKLANQTLDEDKMLLANRLFIAAISGEPRARQYFKEFEKKFSTQLDGANSEEYHELQAMLALWDEKD